MEEIMMVYLWVFTGIFWILAMRAVIFLMLPSIYKDILEFEDNKTFKFVFTLHIALVLFIPLLFIKAYYLITINLK